MTEMGAKKAKKAKKAKTTRSTKVGIGEKILPNDKQEKEMVWKIGFSFVGWKDGDRVSFLKWINRR